MMGSADSVTPRAVAFYCPFCGETDIRPADPQGYRCQVCDRLWEVSLIRVGPGASHGDSPGDSPEAAPEVAPEAKEVQG